MGHINKYSNVYTREGERIPTIDVKGETPRSHKYPGGSTMLSFNNCTGKHTGSHKPIKNHRGKTIKRGL